LFEKLAFEKKKKYGYRFLQHGVDFFLF
jgi:hypothetical protein